MTQTKAMLCAFMAFTGWVVVDAAIKWGSEAALSPYAIMAALGFMGASLIFLRSLVQGELAQLRPVNLREQIFICACSLIINFGCVIALKHVPLTIYYIFALAAPLVIAGLVSVLKHETLTRRKILCLSAGFCGVLIVLVPRGGIGGEWVGYIAALVTTIGFAFYTVMIRKISVTDTSASIQFYNAATVGIAGIVGCMGSRLPPLGALTALIAAGALNVISNFFYNRALAHTAATNVAQLHYTQIITGAIVGYLVWHDRITPSLIAGSLLIVGAGLIVVARAGKSGEG